MSARMKLLPRMALNLFAAVFVAVSAAPLPDDARRENHGFDREMARVRAELMLDAHQEAQWQAAEAAARAARDAVLQDHLQLQQRLAAMRTTRGNIAEMDRELEQLQTRSREARDAACERWLAVYDTLTESQRQVADRYLQVALARLGTVRA